MFGGLGGRGGCLVFFAAFCWAPGPFVVVILEFYYRILATIIGIMLVECHGFWDMSLFIMSFFIITAIVFQYSGNDFGYFTPELSRFSGL